MDTIVYAARLKDREKLKKSSSGGLFTALSDIFLTNGNAMVCCLYNYKTKHTEYRLISDPKDRDFARGSKYMQSLLGDIFRESILWLKKNPEKNLIFFGMGCQVAAFRRFTEVTRYSNRVTFVDIICHGSPSPLIWEEYANNIENNYGKIQYLAFKDKRKGWKNPTALAVVSGEEIYLDDYVQVFYSDCALRPACHKCPYASIKRDTDITIGDFWGIEYSVPDFYDEMGNSLVLIHTDKGIKLFEECKEQLDYRESNINDCLQSNLINPTEVPKERRQFWKDFHQYGINYVMRKYGSLTLKSRIKNKLHYIFRGF